MSQYGNTWLPSGENQTEAKPWKHIEAFSKLTRSALSVVIV